MLAEGYRTSIGNRNHIPISLPCDEMAVTKPDWADFEMEQAYWTSVEEICILEDITFDGLLEIAGLLFPDLPKRDAVQMAIISVYQQLSGRKPVTRLRSYVLHEAQPNRPEFSKGGPGWVRNIIPQAARLSHQLGDQRRFSNCWAIRRMQSHYPGRTTAV